MFAKKFDFLHERRYYTMKKFTKLMVLALVVAALAAIFAIPSSAQTGPVLYIADAGTGDGKTPDAPLGTAADYDYSKKGDASKLSLIQALYKLQPTGGTIVIVGPVTIDTNDSYPTETGKTPAELSVPSNQGVSSNDPDYNVRPTITVTSNYGGVDYRTQGAKLVLDHVKSPSANLRVKSPGIWKDLNIEYRYDLTHTSYYVTSTTQYSFMFECDCTRQVFDTGITCTSVELVTDENGNKKEVEGDLYPTILGAHRQSPRSETHHADVTIKSGTWSFVCAAGYGHNATNHATLSGNAKLTIEGGKIGTIYGTGSVERAHGNTLGKIDITVTGGEIGDVYLTNGNVYTGPGITMTVSEPAVLKGKIHHSPIEGEILPECSVTVNGQLYVAPTEEETTVPATKPTVPVATKPTSNTTKTPTTTKAPVTDDKKEEGSNLTLIIIIVVAAVVVVAAAVVAVVLVKKKKSAK